HDSRAQTVAWQYQSTWRTKDVFHEMAVDYAKKVNDMSGGRLKLDVLAAGAGVPAFQLEDRVRSGGLGGGHGGHGVCSWFYYGGGEALYNELINDILKLNLVGLLYYPMMNQPLGWFKKELKSADEFKGMKYRTVGLSADLFKEMGACATTRPGGVTRA